MKTNKKTNQVETKKGFANVNEMETGDGWQDVTRFTPFHNFQENPVFVGRYVETKFIEKLGDGGSNVLVFETPDGVRMYLNALYNIVEAVKLHGNKLYRIVFTGYTQLEGVQKVSNFTIQVK